jgi:hypothetical protein
MGGMAYFQRRTLQASTQRHRAAASPSSPVGTKQLVYSYTGGVQDAIAELQGVAIPEYLNCAHDRVVGSDPVETVSFS